MLLNQILQFLSNHGVALLFVSVLAGQGGLPVPDVPVLLAVGSLASLGRGSLAESMAVAIIACLIADVFWYQVGRRRRVKLISGAERSSQSEDRLRCAMGAFERHGAGVLFISKFIPGPNLFSPLAGMSGMTQVRFAFLDGFAAAIWTGIYIVAGFIFSSQSHQVSTYVLHLGLALLVVLGCVIIAVGVVRSVHRHWPQKRRLAAMLTAALMLLVAASASAQAALGGSAIMVFLSFMMRKNELGKSESPPVH